MHYPWDESMILVRRNVWLRRWRLGMFRFKTSDRILDLGCGDGLDIEILRKCGVSDITGVDISTKLLAAARKRNPGIRFVRAGAEKLPFRDGAFTVVLIDSMLYHIEGNVGAFQEIRRVMVGDGRVCFIEAHQSMFRKIYDWMTFSPIFSGIPYFRRRRHAYMMEKPGIEHWKKYEKRCMQTLDREFRREFLRIHLLSIIGVYRKR